MQGPVALGDIPTKAEFRRLGSVHPLLTPERSVDPNGIDRPQRFLVARRLRFISTERILERRPSRRPERPLAGPTRIATSAPPPPQLCQAGDNRSIS